MTSTRVTVVTVTYGKRWVFLSQVVEAAMKDERVTKLIIVDNGSKNQEEIQNGVKKFGERVYVIRHEKNTGSAGGFASGLAAARETDCDFVFLLDDDNVPEDGAISKFLEILKFFPDGKVALVGNRADVNVAQDFFYNPPPKNNSSEKLMFRIFSFSNVRTILSSAFFRKNKSVVPFTPIIPMIGFAYGGAFLPIAAVQEASLPDASLVLYGDDSEYSRGISQLGYDIYLCSRPLIRDVDLSFIQAEKKPNIRIPSSFRKDSYPFKTYFSIRNMVRISILYSSKWNPVLFLKIASWAFLLCVSGLIKGGYTDIYLERVKLIVRAIWDGYDSRSQPPKEIVLP